MILTRGDIELVLAPLVGGSIAAFRWRGRDIMRAAPTGSSDPLEHSAFPLVPWSNRIRDGRFVWGNHMVQLPPNYQDGPHSIHGHGWQVPWTVAASDSAHATLTYTHSADAWPWNYYATQHFALTDDGFDYVLTVRNDSAELMPAGLGLHPYFPNPADTQLHARLDGWWAADAEAMPVRYIAQPGDNWTQRLHAQTETDTVFAGLAGPITLDWSTHRLTIRASPNAGWVVVYAPVGNTFAAVEAVTQPTDALNAPGRPGIVTLRQGETAELRHSYRVEAAQP